MNRRLTRAVISHLRPTESTIREDLQSFGAKDWQQTLDWLDDSGLALYFLTKLQTTRTTGMIPQPVLSTLEMNFVHNQARWERLAEEFFRINESFQLTGIRYAVIKGLSLVPDYCPDARLRTPSDLDFLIEEKDLNSAHRALENLGYKVRNNFGIELQFWKPSLKIPTTSDDPYSTDTEALVELHIQCWQHTHRILLSEPLVLLDNLISHSWQGIEFPVLDQTQAFLLQIIHVFQHITTYWVKLCWLLEIGFFLSKRSGDTDFWLKLDAQMRRIPSLPEFAAIVVGLVENVFGSPMPSIATGWMELLRPGSKLWLDKYANDWAIDDHSYRRSAFLRPAKLALFLHQQYLPDPKIRGQVTLNQLFPWKRPDNRLSSPVDCESANALTSLSLRGRFAAERIVFHAGSTLRYLLEVPRWRYRIRHSSAAGLRSDS